MQFYLTLFVESHETIYALKGYPLYGQLVHKSIIGRKWNIKHNGYQ